MGKIARKPSGRFGAGDPATSRGSLAEIPQTSRKKLRGTWGGFRKKLELAVGLQLFCFLYDRKF